MPTSGTVTERAPSAVSLEPHENLLPGYEPGAGFAWLPTRRSDQFIRVDQGLPCTRPSPSCPEATQSEER
jgi:hypothetical protein